MIHDISTTLKKSQRLTDEQGVLKREECAVCVESEGERV